MRRFAALAALGMVVVGVASITVANSVSRDIALRDAVVRGGTFARGVAGPLVSGGLREADPRSVEAFGEVMTNRLRDGSMVHIKVWDSDGHVIWSDQPGLNGRRFTLEEEVRELFAEGGVVGELSSLGGSENALERREHTQLLEVYAAAPAADGRRVVVESYWSTDKIDNDARAVLRRVVPLSLGTLGLFSLLVFPLAWQLAARVDRTQRENGMLVRHALAASDLERRRIARDLHDGVLQDVSGAGYALSAASSYMTEEAELPRRLVAESLSSLHRIGASLRSTMADIYPASLAASGLQAAVEELAAQAEARGVSVHVDVSGVAGESPEAVQLSYRAIREGLRNVVNHSGAQHASVMARRTGAMIEITVDDDGQGPGDAVAGEGHVGLQLLRDTVDELRGSLSVAGGESGGTVLTLRFPRLLAGG